MAYFFNLCMVGNLNCTGQIVFHGVSVCLGVVKSTRLEDSRLQGHIKKWMPPKSVLPKIMHSMKRLEN